MEKSATLRTVELSRSFTAKLQILGSLPRCTYRTSVTDRTKEQCESTIVFDITFVDDEAAVITASVPAHLLSNLQLLVNALIERFAFYGMEINWKPGKTEVILVLRGRNAAQEKSRVKSENAKCFLEVPVSTDGSTLEVHVVSEYKHLDR